MIPFTRPTAALAALMLSTAPAAVEAATVGFDWTIFYTDQGVPSSVRVLLEVEDTPSQTTSFSTIFDITSISATFLTGLDAGTVGGQQQSGFGDTVTNFTSQTFVFFTVADTVTDQNLAIFSLTFAPPSDLLTLTPFSATTDFVSGTGYGSTGGFITDVAAIDTPPIPLPASGALLALAAGAAALRAAAVRRREARVRA